MYNMQISTNRSFLLFISEKTRFLHSTIKILPYLECSLFFLNIKNPGKWILSDSDSHDLQSNQYVNIGQMGT